MTFRLTSSAFGDGQPIPRDYTGDGRNLSPPLAWSDPPDGTVRFALVCDDPDAPRRTWVHWVIFNLPGDQRDLEAGIPAAGSLAGDMTQGKNGFGALGYGGPAPPGESPTATSSSFMPWMPGWRCPPVPPGIRCWRP